MRFGNSKTSENIYKAMKSKSPNQASNVERAVVDSLEGPNEMDLIESTLGGGGAYSSLKKVTPTHEVVPAQEVTIRKKVDINLFEDFLIKSVRNSYDRQDYYITVNALYNMFLSGSLESYSIKGIDKDKILNIIEEFKEALNESI